MFANTQLSRNIKKGGFKNKKFRENAVLLAMSLPAIIVVFVFCYIPMAGIVLAFKEYRYDLGIFKSAWIGLENFKFFFTSNDALRVTRNTVLYGLIFMIAGKVFSIITALLMYEVAGKRKIKTYQTVLLLPHFLSWIIIAYIVYAFFNPDYGFINSIITMLGGDKVSWYNKPEIWPYIFLFLIVWKGTGMACILYYATLMGIDSSYFEAAKLDGASKLKQMWYISVPFLIPIILIQIILGVGSIFRADFGLFYQVTRDQGALYATTDVIDTYIFRALRSQNDIGLSSAVGLFQSFVGFILVVATNKIVKTIDEDKSLY